MAAPIWLLDFLFTGRTKPADPKKLTFILEPWPEVWTADNREVLDARKSAVSKTVFL
jgi:hypothetical protein